jgi:Protein of unknown function (DUF1573)
MKKIFVTLVIVSSLIACKNSDKKVAAAPGLTQEEKEKIDKDTTNYTSMEWIDSTTSNLGKLHKDRTTEVSFRFKNTGSRPLIIESVTAQCGCTIPEKPEQPFAPGEEGVIKAKYNGSGSGTITKQVYVTANTKPVKMHTLTFTGEIIE